MRCMLCGKETGSGESVCEECKKEVSASEVREESSVFYADNDAIKEHSKQLFGNIKPNDGIGWYILAAVLGVLSAVFLISFLVLLSRQDGDYFSVGVNLSAFGELIMLSAVSVFFGQMIKRQTAQIYLNNEIKKELAAIRQQMKK